MTTLLSPPLPPQIASQPTVPLRTSADPLPLADSPRIPALDGLRGVAVLSVILFHWLGILGHHNPILHASLAASRIGWIGVELFFALSGFLITGILADAKFPAASASHFFGTFYGRRLLRIFPLYYGVIALLLLSGLVIPPLATAGYHKFVHDQPWLWLYGVNIGIGAHGLTRFEYDWFDLTHFWTLAVEEHFYLLWPIVIYALSRRKAMAAALFIFLASLALRIVAPPEGSGWVRGLIATPMSAGALAAGAFVALYLRSGVNHARARSLLSRASLLGLMGYIAVILIAHGVSKDLTPVHTAGISFLSLFFSSLVGYVALGPHPLLRRPLQSRPLLTLGKYSYGLYVFHHIPSAAFRHWDFPHLFHHYLPGVLVYLSSATLLTATLACLSWHLYEKQFLKLKRHLPYSSHPPRTRSL